eukprot:8857296-Heterocapsa_arctica.AAC.1
MGMFKKGAEHFRGSTMRPTKIYEAWPWLLPAWAGEPQSEKKLCVNYVPRTLSCKVTLAPRPHIQTICVTL